MFIARYVHFLAVGCLLFATGLGQVYGASIGEGMDYATDQIGNPWDMSNPEDVFPLIWTHNLASANVSAGVMTAIARDTDPHFWLQFPKIPSSILPINSQQLVIDANTYDQLSFYMWLPESLTPGAHNGRLVWHHGGDSIPSWDAAYSESPLFPVYPGWHLYQFDLATLPFQSGRAWGGLIHGLRIDPCLSCNTTFKIDWARLSSSRDSSCQFTLPSGKNRLLVDNDNNPSNGMLGVFPANSGSAALGSLPPGSYAVASISDNDYALSERGDAWDMSSTSDLILNSTSGFSSYDVSGNQFAGITNGADPYVLLDIPALRPIVASKYRYIAIDMTLSSMPALEPGLAIWWGSQTNSPVDGTSFQPTRIGRNTYHIDLSTYSAWQGNIKALRIDPLNGPNAGSGVAVTIHSIRLTSTPGFVETINYQIDPLVINAKPAMTILSPSFDTGEDYATAELGTPWNMLGGDIQNPELGNLSSWEYTSSILDLGVTGNFFHGVSQPAGPSATEGDPYAFLIYQKNDRPIIADNYRLFGFDIYVGFDGSQQSELAQGAMMRVTWKSGDTDVGVSSDDIVLMPGLNTYWLDMKNITYEPASTRTWSGAVPYLRIDPLEFPDSRHFYLGKARLFSLPAGRWVVPITLDLADAEGDTMTVTVKSGQSVLATQTGITPGRAHFLASLGALNEGEHTLTISVSDSINTIERQVPVPIKKLSPGTPHSNYELASTDRVFNWAQAIFPQQLPSGATSSTQNACATGFYSRFYPSTGICLMMADSLLGITMGGPLIYLGTLHDYLSAAASAGF